MTTSGWQDVCERKQKEQLSRIPPAWIIPTDRLPPATTADLRPLAASYGILNRKELEITGGRYDASALVDEIAKGTYSATDVVTAFCKRAAIAQQLCCCLTEIMFQDAIAEAKELDEEFKKTGKPRGPLHGIPMTFKECFHIKGYDASNGYVSRCFNPSQHDSYMIGLVRAAGAVVIAKTNVPQTMLVTDSHNNVFGRVKNPVVSHLTSGGSSGGEGSVLAFRGSSIGIGTDVGGSIRIPAAANGVYGYKPSHGILPLYGYAPSNWPGQNTGIPPVCGPIANSARDLLLLTNVIRSFQPWKFDPALIPHIFESPISNRRPVVGVIRKSGLTPHPPVRRGIEEAVAKLSASGIEVKAFDPPDLAEVKLLTAEIYTPDGLSCPRLELERSGEPPVESVMTIGFWQRKAKTPEEMWNLNKRKMEVQKKMLDKWVETGIDVLMTPAGPHTAVRPGEWVNDVYHVVWNVVDYPVVTIPFTTADPEKDPRDDNFVPLSEIDSAKQALYDPQRMAGAPVGLQIVGSRLGDRQLLSDVQLLDQILKT